MKKLIVLFLALVLIFPFSGCKKGSGNTVFYYPRSQFLYHSGQNVIVAENREIGAHSDSFHSLMSLYLVGPEDESLAMPFPGQTRLISSYEKDGILSVYLTELPEITDAQFSLGCACLALTSLEAFQFEAITITCGERTMTLSAEDLLLQDYPNQDSTEETE